MYKIADFELPSLVLYGDEAEEIMTLYIQFRDAYIKYNASFMPVSMDEAKKVIGHVGELQSLKDKSDELRKSFNSETGPLEKQKIQEQISKLESDMMKAMSKVEGIENLIDQSKEYTPEKLEEIKNAQKELKEITTEILELLSISLKQEDKKTPVISLDNLKILPKGLKYKLIMDVAREPLNGLPQSFLMSLERIVNA